MTRHKINANLYSLDNILVVDTRSFKSIISLTRWVLIKINNKWGKMQQQKNTFVDVV